MRNRPATLSADQRKVILKNGKSTGERLGSRVLRLVVLRRTLETKQCEERLARLVDEGRWMATGPWWWQHGDGVDSQHKRLLKRDRRPASRVDGLVRS